MSGSPGAGAAPATGGGSRARLTRPVPPTPGTWGEGSWSGGGRGGWADWAGVTGMHSQALPGSLLLRFMSQSHPSRQKTENRCRGCQASGRGTLGGMARFPASKALHLKMAQNSEGAVWELIPHSRFYTSTVGQALFQAILVLKDSVQTDQKDPDNVWAQDKGSDNVWAQDKG